MDEKLKRITFSKSLRGYACEEVDTYLRYVADKYEQRSRECTELRRQMALIAAKMNEYTEGLNRTAEAESARKKSVQETCDNMIDEAKRQAAHILADAEAEAEVIRRRAEDNAQTIAANAAREGARVVNDAARSVAARNNAADRLVEEIDSFREEVYALYTRHITELDRLAERTNAFYDRKTTVAEDAMTDTYADDGTAADTYADAAVETGEIAAGDTPDAPIRIDWRNRRAKRDLVIDIAEADETDGAAEPDDGTANGGTAAVDADDIADADTTAPADGDADELDALFRSLTGKNMLTPELDAPPQTQAPTEPTAQAAPPRKPAYDFAADYEDPEESYADSYAAAFAHAELADAYEEPDADGDTYEDPDTESDEYEEPEPESDEYEEPDTESDEYVEPDTESDEYVEPDTDSDEYEDPDTETDEYEEPDTETDAYEEPDTESDEYAVPDTESDEYVEPDTESDEYEDPDTDSDDTDWLLHSLKAQYAAKANPPAATENPDAPDTPDTPQTAPTRAEGTPENFDALLASDTDPVQDISLTGEFDRIYNKEQTEKYMEEVEKQPLNVPEKPKNPKKHKRF